MDSTVSNSPSAKPTCNAYLVVRVMSLSGFNPSISICVKVSPLTDKTNSEVPGEKNREILKPEGLLTRDPRMVERKKFGQKKARKKFQFSKR